ncbi:DinB family protein [Fulvivirgaceae bacterium BMA12]|uniref:DinB family protein n=1 Tax=Agaribacillus aureus TaxID=3051825 RepID=A0ABT8LHF6_9BACT|nr:DinB family protein [Fulvivirgaceae bacterium BMA12]
MNMKFLIVKTICLVSFYSAFAQQVTLTSDERANAVSYLEESKASLLTSLKSLTKDQWHFKSAPDSWSIADVCEHLILVERKFFDTVVNNIVKSGNETGQRSKFRDDEFMHHIKNRDRKVKTTPEFEPAGKFQSKNEFIKVYRKVRKKTIAYIKTTDDDLRHQLATFSPNLGNIDAYQWFLFVTAHNDRHTAQIVAIKQEVHYPK